MKKGRRLISEWALKKKVSIWVYHDGMGERGGGGGGGLIGGGPH